MKLNIGCGNDRREGFLGVDIVPGAAVDMVCNLELDTLPLEDNSVEEFLLSHVLEHISDPLTMMGELYRVAKPFAKMVVRCPYGSSDDAWEDPTHVRPIFHGTFSTFQQPYYWRADYLYRGDWKPVKVQLFLSPHGPSVYDPNAALRVIQTQRNMVREIVAELVAIKPAREPKRELQEAFDVELVRA